MRMPTFSAAFLYKEVRIPRAIFRLPMLLVELGGSAIGLIMVIDWLGRDRSGLSLVIKDGYVAWALLGDVMLACGLAVWVERRSWIRDIAIIFHVAFVSLIVSTIIVFYSDMFPD